MRNSSLKILIIRFSSIGDIVLTTPVIRCLKQQTGATLHFITKKSYHPLLEANPFIDKIYIIQQEITELVDKLKAEGYDYVVDLHKNLRSKRLIRALGVKSFTFNKLNIEKWLLVNFKINRLPEIHIVDRYLQAVVPLGVKNDYQGLDYFIPKGQEVDTNQFFQKYALSIIPNQYIVLVVGAQHATKQLPVEKMIELANKIKQPLLLLGGSNEAELGDEIAKKGTHLINLCGKTTLHQSASIIEQSAVVITHDTGMMHIAAAFQKKIISIWGNTVPAFGMYPYYLKDVDNNTTIEVKDLNCRPCSKIGYQKCPKGHFKCMNQIDIDIILASLAKENNV